MRFTIGALVAFGVLTTTPLFGSGGKPDLCMRWHDLENVPLIWKPTSDIAPPKVVTLTPGTATAAVPSARVEVRAFTDARQDSKRIGENREYTESNGCVYVVTTKDDAAAWMTERVRYLLGRLGFNIVEKDGDVALSGELTRFFVIEGGTYDGEIGLKLDVASRDGKPLWSGLVRGTNGHWGKSFKLENYQETLSDATIDAVQHLAADPGFSGAVGSKPSEPARE